MPATTLKPKKTKKAKGAENEAVSELRSKLKSDLSQASGFSQYLTLRRTMKCSECGATGIVQCVVCNGEGKQRMIWNDEISTCEACEGKGEVTCGECEGRKFVLNPHRKKILILAGIGAACWAWILFSIYGPQVLPEQQAKLLHGGGAGGAAMISVQKGTIGKVPGQGGARSGRAAGGGSRSVPDIPSDTPR
ncbi:MAG: hypothetical protein ABJA67_07730 [Chthonomonadales bacterium]